MKLHAEKFIKIRHKTPILDRKVAGWRHNINIKLLMHFHFLLKRSEQNRPFLLHLLSVLSLRTGNSDNFLYSPNMISNIENCGNGLPQELKSNETSNFAQSCQSRWFSFIDLALEEAILMLKFSWKATYRSLRRKTLTFFARCKVFFTHKSINCSHSLRSEKNLLFSFFICPVRENCQCKSLKFPDSIYRILNLKLYI